MPAEEKTPASHLSWARTKSSTVPVEPKKLSGVSDVSSPGGLSRPDDAVDVWTPIYKWGQRKEKLIITIFVPCLQEDAATIDIKHSSIEFTAERVAAMAGGVLQQRTYRLSLQLLHEVDVDGSEYFLRHDHVRLEIPKRSARLWRTLQAAHIAKNKNERPDFDYLGNESDCSDDDAAPGGRSQPAARRAPADRATAPKGDGAARAMRQAAEAAGLAARLVPELWELPLLLMMAAYVLVCPYSKVEESFGLQARRCPACSWHLRPRPHLRPHARPRSRSRSQLRSRPHPRRHAALQATHDVLYHRTDLAQYDHLAFPGVVPRSFLGPIALAAATAPWALLGELLGGPAPKLVAQLAARVLLGCANVAGLAAVRRATRRQFGAIAGKAFVLLACCQFHGLFYASRTLPNSFATVLVSFACAAWIDGRVKLCLRLLTVATVVFRAELLLLLFPLILSMLWRRQIGLAPLVLLGLTTGAAALVATVAVDSVLWRRLLWPEFEVLYFNTYLNKSQEYGTSPFHWYFTSALPRALLGALPLAAAAAAAVPRARELVLVPCFFVGVYSVLPHKELRFVLYVVPLLNAAAAAALAKLAKWLPPARIILQPDGKAAALSPFASSGSVSKRPPRAAPRARALSLGGRLGVASLLAGSLATSLLLLGAARLNYPGGEVLEQLHAHRDALRLSARQRGGVKVHVGVAAAMTGVSRFLQRPSPWSYSKDESLSSPEDFQRFTYLLTAAEDAPVAGFETFLVARGFSRVQLWPPALLTEPKVRVLKRKTVREDARAKPSGDYMF